MVFARKRLQKELMKVHLTLFYYDDWSTAAVFHASHCLDRC